MRDTQINLWAYLLDFFLPLLFIPLPLPLPLLLLLLPPIPPTPALLPSSC